MSLFLKEVSCKTLHMKNEFDMHENEPVEEDGKRFRVNGFVRDKRQLLTPAPPGFLLRSGLLPRLNSAIFLEKTNQNNFFRHYFTHDLMSVAFFDFIM